MADIDSKIAEKVSAYKQAVESMMRATLPAALSAEQERLMDFFVSQFEVAFRCGVQEGMAMATRKEFISSDVN